MSLSSEIHQARENQIKLSHWEVQIEYESRFCDCIAYFSTSMFSETYFNVLFTLIWENVPPCWKTDEPKASPAQLAVYHPSSAASSGPWKVSGKKRHCAQWWNNVTCQSMTSMTAWLPSCPSHCISWLWCTQKLYGWRWIKKNKPPGDRDVAMNLCSDTSHHHAGPVRAQDLSEYLCLAQSLPEGLTRLEERAHTGGHLLACRCVCVRERDGPISHATC